jgi:protein-disulfide isomerase
MSTRTKTPSKPSPAKRPSRLVQLGALLALAAIVVVVAIVASSGGSDGSSGDGGTTATIDSAPATALQGIPESGPVLGNPDAKVTLTEFVDLQCPVCAQAASQTMPTIIERYVRTGKVKVRVHVLSFLGEDSVEAGRYAAGAAQQNRLWPFIETFYGAQGEENSGYVTQDFLAAVAQAANVDDAKAAAYASTGRSQTFLEDANAAAETLGVNSTPTFLVQRGNGTPALLGSGQLDPAQLSQALDAELAK